MLKTQVGRVTRSLRTFGTVAALSIALATVPLMGGCASDDATSGTEGDDVAISTESDGAEASTETADETAAFDYSAGITEDGMWEGITALDYVTLPDYETIEVPASAVTPTEDEIQAQVDSLVSSYAEQVQITDRAIEDGDSVNIDYAGSIDGVEFEGGSTGGAGTTVTIGVTNYIDDFLEQLIGHKPGESFDIEVTFPEDYGNEELNGKDAVFSITVNYIVETVTPEVTDAWVAETLTSYGWTTIAEMEESFASMLQSDAITTYVQEWVLANAQVSGLPESMVAYQEGAMIDYYEQYAAMFGMELEEFISMVAGASTTEELIEANREMLDQGVAGYLVFQAIAEDAGLTVEDGEVGVYFQEVVGVSDYSGYVSTYGMPYLKMCVMTQEVIDLLVSNAVVVDDAQDAQVEDAGDEAEDAQAEEDAKNTTAADEAEVEEGTASK